MRAKGFCRSPEKEKLPRSRGKWLQAYSASDPNTSVPRRFPVTWPRLAWATPAARMPVG